MKISFILWHFGRVRKFDQARKEWNGYKPKLDVILNQIRIKLNEQVKAAIEKELHPKAHQKNEKLLLNPN